MSFSLVSIDPPKITDWLTAIAAIIGIPLSLVAVIKLIIRDRDREKQIAGIVTIASQLKDQVQELSAQTQEFKYQSEIMFDHNKLFEIQLALQAKSQKENLDLQAEHLELQKQKQRNAIKPYFMPRDSTPANGMFWNLTLVNHGDRANEITCRLSDPNQGKVEVENHEVGRNGTLNIQVNFVDAPTTRELDLSYQDSDGNRYSQIVNHNAQDVNVSKPLLISNP